MKEECASQEICLHTLYLMINTVAHEAILSVSKNVGKYRIRCQRIWSSLTNQISSENLSNDVRSYGRK